MKPGEAMDLITGWGFTLERRREPAEKYIEKNKPMLVIGSPECTMLIPMQNINKAIGPK